MSSSRPRTRSQPRGIFFKNSQPEPSLLPETKPLVNNGELLLIEDAVEDDEEDESQDTPVSAFFKKGKNRRPKTPDAELPPPVLQLMHYEVTLTNDVSEYLWNGFAHDWNHASSMAFKETNYGDEKPPIVTNIVCNGEVSRKQMVKVLSESLDVAMKDRKFRLAMIATGFRGYNHYSDKELRDEYVSNLSTQ